MCCSLSSPDALLSSELVQLIHTFFHRAQSVPRASLPQTLPSYAHDFLLCSFWVTGSSSPCQHIEVLMHLRGARSAKGSTWHSLTTWCWVYSSVHWTPLGQQQPTPIPGGFPVLSEARLWLFLLHCTNSHQALIYGLKEDEKKGGTIPGGAGILWSQS